MSAMRVLRPLLCCFTLFAGCVSLDGGLGTVPAGSADRVAGLRFVCVGSWPDDHYLKHSFVEIPGYSTEPAAVARLCSGAAEQRSDADRCEETDAREVHDGEQASSRRLESEAALELACALEIEAAGKAEDRDAILGSGDVDVHGLAAGSLWVMLPTMPEVGHFIHRDPIGLRRNPTKRNSHKKVIDQAMSGEQKMPIL